MIGVSDAPPPRRSNQPELAVDELSQICEGLARQRPENMPALLNALALIAPLLNAIPNVVFFIKDRQARYLLANLTLARRCGFKSVSSLLGKTSADVFPSALGQGYTEQDLRVLREGVTLRDQLEMHLYNGRERGWCLTQKPATRYQRAGDRHGRDLARSAGGPCPPSGVAAAGDRRRSYPPPLSPADRHGGVDRLKWDVDCADRTLLQTDLSSHSAANDPQSAAGKSYRTAGWRYADYRYRLAVRVYRSQRL